MIYIHIPYCHRKCTYCAFYSAVTSADKQAYVDALCHELSVRHDEMDKPISTVYLGGGTPSLLTIAQLGQIADTIRQQFDTSSLQEITLECNPEDLTPAFLHQLQGLEFFNRISIGVQSFGDADLRLLNRRHTSDQSIKAILAAADAGFGNVSIDLIYGLPNQSLHDWQHNLDIAAQLPFTHLSAYALTVEDGTMLHRQLSQGRIATAEEAMVIAHYDALLSWAQHNGLQQYEISNFSRPGFHSKHNSRYWDRTPYLGAGAAAHSFDGTHRRWNIANAEQYINAVKQGNTYYETETLTPQDAHNEYLMTALRTTEGIDKKLLHTTFAAQLAQRIQPYIKAGLICDTPTHYRPTHDGLLHADGLAAELFV